MEYFTIFYNTVDNIMSMEEFKNYNRCVNIYKCPYMQPTEYAEVIACINNEIKCQFREKKDET